MCSFAQGVMNKERETPRDTLNNASKLTARNHKSMVKHGSIEVPWCLSGNFLVASTVGLFHGNLGAVFVLLPFAAKLWVAEILHHLRRPGRMIRL